MDTIATGLHELSLNNEELPLSIHKVESSYDMLNEILLKLPVTSLVLFKSVSKRWLSLIKDATFVKRQSPKIDPPSGLLNQFRYWPHPYGSVSFDIRIPLRDEKIFKTVLSTVHFLKFPENSFGVLKLLENSVEVLKILENKLESMRILENKFESLKLQENQPVDRLVPLSIKKITSESVFARLLKSLYDSRRTTSPAPQGHAKASYGTIFTIITVFLEGVFGGSIWRDVLAGVFGGSIGLQEELVEILDQDRVWELVDFCSLTKSSPKGMRSNYQEESFTHKEEMAPIALSDSEGNPKIELEDSVMLNSPEDKKLRNRSRKGINTYAVNQQTSVVTTAMTVILKQFQATPPPASVKAVEEICVTCGAAINYNQGNSGYRPSSIANQIRPLDTSYQAPIQQNQVVPLSELEKIKKINEVNIKAMQAQINNVKNELRNEMQTLIQASMSNQTNELKNMMASFFQMNTASSLGSGSLPGNTIANPKGKLKAITTQSGLVLDGPSVSMPPPFINP
ncbi:reverse transcriptase domain-containing protein [Tanacetum coccineum]